jgi:carbamate kinase
VSKKLSAKPIVSSDDSAFRHPTNPIGVFYSQSQAEELRQRGFAVVEDAGRGYWRVVPSPVPMEIVELDTNRRLMGTGTLVIAAGGGGIPLVRNGGSAKQKCIGRVERDEAIQLLAEEHFSPGSMRPKMEAAV